MDLINKIRTLRESKGLTQEDLADKFGVTRSNYAYLEGRGSKLTIEQLEKIAVALGVSVIELLTGEGQKEEESEREKKLEQRVKELEERIKEQSERLYSMKQTAMTTLQEAAKEYFESHNTYPIVMDGLKFKSIYEVTQEFGFWVGYHISLPTTLINLGLIDDEIIKKHYQDYVQMRNQMELDAEIHDIPDDDLGT